MAWDAIGLEVKMGNDSVAILFYSLYSSGDLDTFSWHCGCPVESGTKWAANSDPEQAAVGLYRAIWSPES